MNFIEAIKLVTDNKLVRRKLWYGDKPDNREHLGLENGDIYWRTHPPQEDFYVTIFGYIGSIEDILAEDWEELVVFSEIRCRRISRMGERPWLDDRYCAEIPIHRLTGDQLSNLLESDRWYGCGLTPPTIEAVKHEIAFRKTLENNLENKETK